MRRVQYCDGFNNLLKSRLSLTKTPFSKTVAMGVWAPYAELRHYVLLVLRKICTCERRSYVLLVVETYKYYNTDHYIFGTQCT